MFVVDDITKAMGLYAQIYDSVHSARKDYPHLIKDVEAV